MSTLNVRINHKYDSYAAWQASSLILGKGEIAVCEIPSTATETGLTPPAIGVKIGDGTKTFSQLAWIQSTAGDVYAWAKADKKPEYKAEEIEGLEDFIAGEIQDTDTTYSFSFTDNVLTVKSKSKGSDEETTVFSQAIDLTTKVDKVADAVEGNVVEFGAAGAVKDSGKKLSDYLTSADAAGTYATKTELGTLEETVSGINERLGTAEGEIDELQEAMEVLNGEATVEGSVKKQVADAIAGVVASAPEDFDTLKEIADWIANDQTGAAALTNRVAANEQAIAALEEDSHVHENEDVLNAITSDKVAAWDGAEAAAKSYADGIVATEAQAREAVADRVTTLEGVVGKTAEEGLQKAVADNTGAIAALEEKATTWDAAVQTISGVETTKTGTDVAVTAVPVNILKNVDGDTLVFECGTSTTVI